MNAPLSPGYLAEIRARVEAASPGPWLAEDDHQRLNRWVVSEQPSLNANLGYLGNRSQDDAAFIAHARVDIPALLAELEARPSRAEVLREAADKLERIGHRAAAWILRDDAEQAGKRTPAGGESTQAAAELTVYRAGFEGHDIPLGLYTTREAARAHCEAYIRREWPEGTRLSFDWITDGEDSLNPDELYVTAGQCEESTTGYLVTPLTVASEYDAEADE